MKKIISALAFSIPLLMTGMVGLILVLAIGVTSAFVALPKQNPSNMVIHTNGIQKEVWVDYIISNLFKSSDFMNYCFNESNSVLNGAVVHIPQAGSKATVVKNRSSLPATISQRTDTDITYALDVYTTDPTLIRNADQLEISYDKIGSVLTEHVESLREVIGDYLLYSWCPTVTGQIIRTTGSAVATALAPSATGTRKKFLKEDLKEAQRLMNKQNIPAEDRYALVPTDMYSQLMDDTDLIKRDVGKEVDLRTGVVMELYGFKILQRSATTIYDAASPPQPKAVDAVGATTDNLAVICWQKNMVAKAMGTVDFFENLRSPEYYGDVYSAEVRLGGRKRRSDGAGVVAIVQTT